MTPACDVLFLFDQNSMCSKIAFLAPYLLYNTLADNLVGDMALMDPLALDDAMNVREDILAKLKEGFEQEGIVVDIDETTGRVTMDNHKHNKYSRNAEDRNSRPSAFFREIIRI